MISSELRVNGTGIEVIWVVRCAQSCGLSLWLRASRVHNVGMSEARGYRSIAHDLSRRIAEGVFPLGSLLPPENQLAAEYGVARGTLRHALTELARVGMLTPRQGAGWTIHSSLQTHSFGQLRSFAEWARSKGMTPGGRVVASRWSTVGTREGRQLRVAPGTSVLTVTRLRSLDGRNVMVERTVYPPWIASTIESLPDDEPSVVSALERILGVTTAHADHTLDAVAASSDDMRLLGVRRSSPLLRVQRTSFASDGRAIEVGDDRYLPGTVSFHVQTSTASNSLVRSLN